VNPSARFTNMKLGMFGGTVNDFPCLKGKANEIRHIGKPLLKAFEVHMNKDSAVDKQILVALKLSVRFETLLDENQMEYVLPDKAHKEFVKVTFGFCQVYSAIAHHFHSRKVPLFNFTIKFHLLLHVALVSKWVNPRKVWCYAGEDMMDKIKHVVMSCVAGTGPQLVISKCMKKYVTGMGYELANLQRKLDCEV